MTTRIKYVTMSGFYGAKITNIFGREVTITITKNSPHKVSITKLNDTENGLVIRKFEQESLQNAKRKVRQILTNEFDVNLGDEVRNKLCS